MEDAMVTAGTLARARAGDEQAFRELTDPYRGELLAHCYQILGSVADAEDMLQETLLAPWRGLTGFEGPSSGRAWLHRIPVNGCLNALRHPRPAPAGRARGGHARRPAARPPRRGAAAGRVPRRRRDGRRRGGATPAPRGPLVDLPAGAVPVPGPGGHPGLPPPPRRPAGRPAA